MEFSGSAEFQIGAEEHGWCGPHAQNLRIHPMMILRMRHDHGASRSGLSPAAESRERGFCAGKQP